MDWTIWDFWQTPAGVSWGKNSMGLPQGPRLMAWTTKSPILENHWVPCGCMAHLGSVKTLANFHNFWPLPPYHRHSSKMLMKRVFDPYLLWPFDHRHMGTPFPPKTCIRLKWMVPKVIRQSIAEWCWQTFCFQMFCLYTWSKLSPNNLNFHWRWRWWEGIQAILHLFYFMKICSWKTDLLYVRIITCLLLFFWRNPLFLRVR